MCIASLTGDSLVCVLSEKSIPSPSVDKYDIVKLMKRIDFLLLVLTAFHKNNI